MTSVVDINQAASQPDEFTDSSKPPFSTRTTPPKKIPSWQITPEFLSPADFPADAAAILKQNRITRKQFTRFAEALALQAMRQCGADFLISIHKGIRLGDNKAMEMFCKISGLMKNDAQTVINLGQSVSVTNVTNNRHFDSIVRSLDDRDRHSRVEPPPIVIDVAEEAVDASVATR
jgi:hypothetical protein